MIYNIEDTDWPAFGVSSAKKDLISRFFKLLDTEEESVGDVLAEEVFAPDARAEFSGRLFSGKEEIRKSRDNAWTVISSRRHKVLKVFSASIDSDDIMIIGHVEMGFRNGKTVEGEFAGRIIFQVTNSDAPILALYQMFADSAPITRALQPE